MNLNPPEATLPSGDMCAPHPRPPPPLSPSSTSPLYVLSAHLQDPTVQAKVNGNDVIRPGHVVVQQRGEHQGAAAALPPDRALLKKRGGSSKCTDGLSSACVAQRSTAQSRVSGLAAGVSVERLAHSPSCWTLPYQSHPTGPCTATRGAASKHYRPRPTSCTHPPSTTTITENAASSRAQLTVSVRRKHTQPQPPRVLTPAAWAPAAQWDRAPGG